MADPKVLTAGGWKTVSGKCKVQNNDLLKALAEYEKLAEDEHEELLECILEIKQEALALKKKAAANKELINYLTDMIATAEAEHRCVSKDKADYDKENMTRKKAEEAKKYQDEDEEEDDEEEEDGEYADQLLAALQKLKGAKDVEYEFIVCEAKPHPCIMVAKKIGPKHKEQLTKMTGSKRFLHVGTCKVQEGKYYFNMEKPASGLARKMQASIKHHTGKKLAINVGNEVCEEDEPDYRPEAEGAYSQPGRPTPGQEPLLNATDPDRRRGEPLLNATDPDRPQEPLLNATNPDQRPAGASSISGSVGQGGKNIPADVTTVQNALNAKAKAGLKVDGKCGPKTIGAIIQFQKQMGMPKPDGRIDQGRGTARALWSVGPLPPPPPAPKPVTPPRLGKADLAKAPQIWHGMRQIVDTNIEQVKRAVKAHYAHEHPALVKEIDENLEKLDAITDKLDHRIAECLQRAYAAKDEAARKAELKAAKTILAEYIGYVKSEKLIAHVDANPWVKIDLKKTLVDHMTHMAQSIG